MRAWKPDGRYDAEWIGAGAEPEVWRATANKKQSEFSGRGIRWGPAVGVGEGRTPRGVGARGVTRWTRGPAREVTRWRDLREPVSAVTDHTGLPGGRACPVVEGGAPMAQPFAISPAPDALGSSITLPYPAPPARRPTADGHAEAAPLAYPARWRRGVQPPPSGGRLKRARDGRGYSTNLAGGGLTLSGS